MGELERQKAMLLLSALTPAPQEEPERMLGIREAAERVSLSVDYLHRHWRKLGGFKGPDSKIKFPLAALLGAVRRP